MASRRREGQFGGGIFLAVAPIAGLAVGAFLGEPSIGLVAGIATGVALALFAWRRMR